jgi:hypothetical protein
MAMDRQGEQVSKRKSRRPASKKKENYRRLPDEEFDEVILVPVRQVSDSEEEQAVRGSKKIPCEAKGCDKEYYSNSSLYRHQRNSKSPAC